MTWIGHWPYFATIVLMMVGLYIVIARENLVKKMMGLNIFQGSVIMLYVSMGKVSGATAPILPSHPVPVPAHGVLYSNPVPHVLMLTAIVVGVATTALALALVVRIFEAYGTAEEDEIFLMDRADLASGAVDGEGPGA